MAQTYNPSTSEIEQEDHHLSTVCITQEIQRHQGIQSGKTIKNNWEKKKKNSHRILLTVEIYLLYSENRQRGLCQELLKQALCMLVIF